MTITPAYIFIGEPTKFAVSFLATILIASLTLSVAPWATPMLASVYGTFDKNFW